MSNAACRELLMQILDMDDLDQGCLLMELAFIEFEENQMKVHEVQLRETLNENNFG